MMWVCTDWAYDAESFAAWGTWAAVMVALGAGLWSGIARWRRRLLDGRLTAALLFHDVSNADMVLESVATRVPYSQSTGGIWATLLAADKDGRIQLASDMQRASLPSIERWQERLSLLPRADALAVVELHSHLSFLHLAGRALATGREPPDDFYPELQATVIACIAAAQRARVLLGNTGFPDGRPKEPFQ